MTAKNAERRTSNVERRAVQLTGRADLAAQLRNEERMRRPLARLRESLAEIRPLWDRLQPEQRETIEAKDPVLQLARELYDELGKFFDA